MTADQISSGLFILSFRHKFTIWICIFYTWLGFLEPSNCSWADWFHVLHSHFFILQLVRRLSFYGMQTHPFGERFFCLFWKFYALGPTEKTSKMDFSLLRNVLWFLPSMWQLSHFCRVFLKMWSLSFFVHNLVLQSTHLRFYLMNWINARTLHANCVSVNSPQTQYANILIKKVTRTVNKRWRFSY
jgi:hypothetical protein